jgi:hypothetical protein
MGRAARKGVMKKRVIAAALICLPAGVWAWQGTMAEVGVTESALQSQIERASRQKDDWLNLSLIGPKQLVAAKLLPQPQQIALMKELAAAARAIVMAPAFLAAHDAFIAKEHQAVNHGLKVKSPEQMLAQLSTSEAGAAEFEAKIKRDMGAVYVAMVKDAKIADLKMMLDMQLPDWTKDANNVKGSDRAKYQKVVKGAAAIEGLAVSDPEKFRRGLAVLLSTVNDGPDTEAALYGASAASQKETEQVAWDKHNLRGALKRLLTQAVAEAPTVDYAAQTVEKSGVRVFVNPAYEKKSATWKAMYRAGKGPATAGVAIAAAWLKEL